MEFNSVYVIASVIFVHWETEYYGNNLDPLTWEEQVADAISLIIFGLAFICV